MASQIKGVTLKSRIEFVESVYGHAALAKLLPHLKGEVRELVTNPRRIMAISWYDIDVQVRLDETICKVLAAGDKDVYRRMGAHSAEFQERNIALKQFTDPWRVLYLQSTVFSRFFRPGKAEMVKVSQNECLMQIHGFGGVRENCDTNMGFLKRALELSGAKEVDMVETQCAAKPGVPFCEYRIRWK